MGDPSDIFLIFGETGAIIFLFISLVAAFLWFIRRENPSQAKAGVDRRAAMNWPRRIFLGSTALTLLCAALVVVILESVPGHAWRNRARTTLLIAVDAQTNFPLPIEVNALDEPSDRYLVMSMTWRKPSEVEVCWNVDLPLEITSAGYEKQTWQLGDISGRTVLRLIRSTRKNNK